MRKYYEKPTENSHSWHKDEGEGDCGCEGFFAAFSCIFNTLLLDLPSFVPLPFLQSECLSTLPALSPALPSPFGENSKSNSQFCINVYHFSSLMFVIISVNPPDSSPANALSCLVKVSIIPPPMSAGINLPYIALCSASMKHLVPMGI